MNKKRPLKRVMLSLYHYFCFFLFMAFFITCCMLLFWNIMSETMNLSLTEGNINTAAVLTFGNVVFLSLVCTVIDGVRRKITVDRPVKKIVSAAEQIAKGDYSVRIEPLNNLNRADGLDEIIDCYNKMAEELSGIESLQSDFIANVSHELKTPLAIMQNYATLLQDPELDKAQRIAYAKSISDASRRLADLITNILKLNKLENQQIYPAVKEYDLNSQLLECLLNFENIWEEKNIEIRSELNEDVIIKADPELLSLVWNNLFSNAFKFTSAGGFVGVSLKTEDGMAVVEVSDSGCGITPEIGKHIFEKFYQGDTSHATQGNGLGLALVKRVIDIVGGDITVSSNVGQGSIFTVGLKLNG
jgi:signal transduction histidine kinase